MGSSKGIYRILVADDEPTIRKLVEEALRQDRHYVKSCEDGLEVLSALEQASFSALFLDGMMPRMTGFEVVRTLRAQGEEVPVVLMTELDEETVRPLCEGLGLVTVLHKPFGLQELRDALKNVGGRIRS